MWASLEQKVTMQPLTWSTFCVLQMRNMRVGVHQRLEQRKQETEDLNPISFSAKVYNQELSIVTSLELWFLW